MVRSSAEKHKRVLVLRMGDRMCRKRTKKCFPFSYLCGCLRPLATTSNCAHSGHISSRTTFLSNKRQVLPPGNLQLLSSPVTPAELQQCDHTRGEREGRVRYLVGWFTVSENLRSGSWHFRISSTIPSHYHLRLISQLTTSHYFR